MMYRLLKTEILAVQTDLNQAISQGSSVAVLRVGLRAALLLFIACFKWTIPLVVVFLLNYFGGI